MTREKLIEARDFYAKHSAEVRFLALDQSILSLSREELVLLYSAAMMAAADIASDLSAVYGKILEAIDAETAKSDGNDKVH